VTLFSKYVEHSSSYLKSIKSLDRQLGEKAKTQPGS
jgi:hypothetical protein